VILDKLLGCLVCHTHKCGDALFDELFLLYAASPAVAIGVIIDVVIDVGR